MRRRHHFAFRLRHAMCFPEPEAGRDLDEFLKAVDPQQYLFHMEVVGHNRWWLAGRLFRQKRYDEAVEMLRAARAAEEQIMLAQACLIAGGTRAGDA